MLKINLLNFRAINERYQEERRNADAIARLWGQLVALVEEEKRAKLASIAALKREEEEYRKRKNED